MSIEIVDVVDVVGVVGVADALSRAANLKEALVAELPPPARRCVARVFDSAANGRDGLMQAVAATLADVVGGAQLRSDLVELEQLMDALRVDDGGSAAAALTTTLTAIGPREVRAALRMHAVERLLVHSAAAATFLVEPQPQPQRNRHDDDDGDDAAAAAAGDDARIVVPDDVAIVRVSTQSPAAQQFLAGFGGVAARLSWPVPRELLE